MDFRILGPLEVADEGRQLELGGSRQRQLLAVLLLHRNEVVSSDRLIDHLWGAEPPPAAAKGLQVHISRLRKALGPRGTLVTHAGGYTLRAGVEDLDAARFEQLVERGRECLAAGDAAEAAAALREALGLWRGRPLAEFAYEAFAQAEIARLEELHVAALEERIGADLALGRHAVVVGELEALVTEHPLRERLRAHLMLALYRSGRQAEALAAYQDARRALVDELGIDPSRALQDVEQAILRHDPTLDLEIEQLPPSSPEPDVEVPRARRRAPPPERKLATVVFVDVAGSTKLGEQDPERYRALLEGYYDAVAAEIDAAGGTVGEFAGNAVLATFGAPAAQEDHAERALHAALAVRSRCNELFAGETALQIGINTGEVVVGCARDGSSFVTGDTVNVAAGLELAAEPGNILVGERTAAAAHGAFEFDQPAAVSVKGKTVAVASRRLVRALAPVRPRGVAGLRSSFVGRQRELDLLWATYRRAVEAREPHLLTIVGNAGVGKTRLVSALWEQFERESPEPLRHLGRCLPYGRGVTYWPLGEVLKSQLSILESDPVDVVRARLGERQILAVTLGLEPPPDLHPLVARETLHAAWVEFLDELVAERPAAILVEGIHWAEQPLFDLLDRLRREVTGPLLLVATARPELFDRRQDWGAGGRNTTQLWLEPLSTEDAEQLLEELLKAKLPARLRRLVLERAEGNPFYLEELLATLIDSGLLERRNGGWIARDPPPDFAIPDSVQSVLAARIDLLDATPKAALQAAAVVGRVFWAGPVAELLGGVEIDWPALEERDFVRRRLDSTLADEREFAFKHALTREVAYSSLPKARRGRLHAAFAAWLERFGDGRDEYAPLLAHHYAEAVRPEDVDLAWPDEMDEVGRLRTKAQLWLRRAAELAGTRYALDDQIGLLRRAVELEPNDAGLWRAIARANARKYDQSGFRTAMLSAVEASSGDDIAELYGELAFWDAFRWAHAEDRELIGGWIAQALELAAPASPARARALIARSYCHPEKAEEAAHDACAIAERLPDVELRSYAYHASADSALAQGRYDAAREWAERRLELLDHITDPDHVADVYWSAIPGYLGHGRFAEARKLAELHDEVTSGLSPHHRLHGVAFLLEIEELGGNWETIRALTKRAEQAVDASTPCVHRPRSLVVCALAAACVGEEEEARRLESLADALAAEEYGRVADARLRLALVRADLERAEQILAESERPAKTLIRSTKLAPVAARLDALAALRKRGVVEREAPPLVRAGTYLEPFALRALGLVRDDPNLLEQAVGCFDAMALAWYATQTRDMLFRMV